MRIKRTAPDLVIPCKLKIEWCQVKGEPRGLELENAHTIYRYAKGRFAQGIREERKTLIPSVIDGFLWSLRDSNP